MNRLNMQHPALYQVMSALGRQDDRTALKTLRGQRQPLRSATEQLMALWQQNTGSDRDENLEQWGWRLAELWRSAGEATIEQSLGRAQSQLSQEELGKVQQGTWQAYESDLGFAVHYPAAWTVSVEVDGRYHRTYFRSASPHVSVMIEKAQRLAPLTESAVDWTGMEKEFRKRYKKSYRRTQMMPRSLGQEEAGFWVFEMKRDNGPRLRRMYLGRAKTWDSYVLTCSVPAADAAAWRPIFEQIIRSFEFRY